MRRNAACASLEPPWNDVLMHTCTCLMRACNIAQHTKTMALEISSHNLQVPTLKTQTVHDVIVRIVCSVCASLRARLEPK